MPNLTTFDMGTTQPVDVKRIHDFWLSVVSPVLKSGRAMAVGGNVYIIATASQDALEKMYRELHRASLKIEKIINSDVEPEKVVCVQWTMYDVAEMFSKTEARKAPA